MGTTIERFADMYIVEGQTYVVRVSGHVMVVSDGKVFDNISKSAVPAEDHPKARTRVKNVFVVA